MLFLVASICTMMPCLLGWIVLTSGLWTRHIQHKILWARKKKPLLDITERVNSVLMDGHFSNIRVRGMKLIPEVKSVIYENRRVTDLFLNVPSWCQTRQCTLCTMINWQEKNDIQPTRLGWETHTNLTHTHHSELSSNKLTGGFGSTHVVCLIPECKSAALYF